jgi:catechol 2,3-dioxygenase-like lactoylglutathione lyase family enzyme
MLSAIVAVTLLVPDVDAAARAWQQSLGYRAVAHGTLPTAQAAVWAAPALAGRDYALLQPASGEPVLVRLVETPAPAAAPMKALGWNATELLVEDPALLAARLEGSPFRLLAPPAPLDFNPAVTAMQALGPAGELLYFTRMPPGASKFGLGSAASFVDRVFIVVLGVRDLRSALDFYASTFGNPVTEPVPTRVGILADAWNLPQDRPFMIGIVRLPARFLIEVDEYPPQAPPRRAAPGELPAGLAMVSFEVPSLEPLRPRLLAAPVRLEGLPYRGRRSALMLGPAGEHLELIEAESAANASGDRP